MSASRVGRALRTREPPFRVMEQPGVRALSMEWADYTNNQEVVPALRALCTTWDKNSLVRCILVNGKIGNFGGFSAGDEKQLRENAALYATLAELKTPAVTLIGGIFTSGGVGMCAGVTVASDTAIFVPPLRADTLKNAPNFVDGGASFKLSRAGAAGRLAALSGLLVKGAALKSCGLVTHVVSAPNLNVLGDEIVSVIGEDEEDDAILYQGVRDAIDHRDMTGSAFLETHEDALKLERLATLCFEQPDLAAIKAALAACDDPLAAEARHNIETAGGRAGVLAELLQRAAKTDLRGCLRLERTAAARLPADGADVTVAPRSFFD